uniref:Purine nucleoside phosphorylase n=1 Tax=Trichuris muris TaxID=70415 RepID=A0A5S6QPT3_TRIMR
MHQRYSDYETVNATAQFVKGRIKRQPQLGIVCGSGLGQIPELFENCETLPYADIPNFPISTVKGHKGNLVFGTWQGASVVCMQGRIHPYEGVPMNLSVMPIRLMKLLGVRTIIITNAAGGVNPNYNVGDIMLIKDHIGLTCLAHPGPLVGENDERFGPRFPSMSCVYDKRYRAMLKRMSEKCNIKIQEGVYCMTFGPQYESPAEARSIRQIGADAVGMSTVHEVITAAHCGMKILGMSIITNKLCCDCDEVVDDVSHEEVLTVMTKASGKVLQLLSLFVKEWYDTQEL